MTARSPHRLRSALKLCLYRDEERPVEESRQLLRIMMTLADRPLPPPEVTEMWPDYERLHRRFVESVSPGSDPELVEERFSELYCHLHGHEAPYTADEREIVHQTGGYWCHAGGLSPLLKASGWIEPDSVSADFGAGNGLQCLLLQKLYPHRSTVQIEISSRMVAAGQSLQRWLDIPEDRVVWRVDDVRDVSPRGLDFIYLYRPLKPTTGAGESFYRRFAEALATDDREVVIFSIADCLRDFLPTEIFEVFYHDGHLTCFRRR